MVTRTLFFRRRGREERLGVRREERGAVGRVEAFWKHDYLRPGLRGFEDFGAGVREVGGFVCSFNAEREMVSGVEGGRRGQTNRLLAAPMQS
jgi:hypothetical protein